MKACLIIFIAIACRTAYAEILLVGPNGHLSLHRGVQDWKSQRDRDITKQDFDFSCGAASMATLLQGAFGFSITELQLLQLMDKQNGRASFEDMAQALQALGFQAQGYSATFSQLKSLKIPVILYVKNRKYDHFTVLRGINQDTIWLADPSVGNQTLSRHQFLEMWETNLTQNDNGVRRGRFLAILPSKSGIDNGEQFFDLDPKRQSHPAVIQIPSGLNRKRFR
ncbi:C39 family peptidase [Achromobacter xylosoxidans]|uniref:C39 family peptidase n=1 Tax=Alcaligenes xylosoxydans xylosoxydans TaxID=85698 RepID=UPI0018FEB702|nr:C39 family peptidase [Achromobacter xylosoxidans]MCH4593746.1 C39 family peptidase [Achromobacter xylosoxidans]